MSPDPHYSDVWEEFSDMRLRHSLIITKSQEIRMQVSDRSKDISLISEDHMRHRECRLYMMESIVLMMHWMSSLPRDHSMISGYHNRHLVCEVLRLRQVELMPRMENIKCTETHHMVKLLICMRSLGIYTLYIGSLMRRIGE